METIFNQFYHIRSEIFGKYLMQYLYLGRDFLKSILNNYRSVSFIVTECKTVLDGILQNRPIQLKSRMQAFNSLSNSQMNNLTNNVVNFWSLVTPESKCVCVWFCFVVVFGLFFFFLSQMYVSESKKR